MAEQSPGFVWRLQTDDGDATAIRPFGEKYLVNLSVWRDIESLHGFVYRSGHTEIMRRRKEWFEKMREAYSVLWWIPKRHRPTVEEAKARLETLETAGPSPEAFTFKHPFPAPDGSRLTGMAGLDGSCPAR